MAKQSSASRGGASRSRSSSKTGARNQAKGGAGKSSGKSHGRTESRSASGGKSRGGQSATKRRAAAAKGGKASGGSRSGGGASRGGARASRSSGRASRSGGGRASSAAAATKTIDHEEIRRWVEERGGKPVCVRGTGGDGDTGLLRIDMPGYTGADKLAPISWDEWFGKFEEKNLALLYQDKTKGGRKSNFNKLVER